MVVFPMIISMNLECYTARWPHRFWHSEESGAIISLFQHSATIVYTMPFRADLHIITVITTIIVIIMIIIVISPCRRSHASFVPVARKNIEDSRN